MLPVMDARASAACVSSSANSSVSKTAGFIGHVCNWCATLASVQPFRDSSCLQRTAVQRSRLKTKETPPLPRLLRRRLSPCHSDDLWSVDCITWTILFFCSSTRNAYNIFSVITSMIHKSDHGGTSEINRPPILQRILQLR